MIADIVNNLWPKRNLDQFSFVFFGISFVYPKMDGHAANLLQNSWHFCWWLLTYIHIPGQSFRIKFNIFCFLEQTTIPCLSKRILHLDSVYWHFLSESSNKSKVLYRKSLGFALISEQYQPILVSYLFSLHLESYNILAWYHNFI